MKNFTLNDITYKIPTSWEEINLKKFLKIREHESKVNDMKLVDYNLDFLSIVTGIHRRELETLTPVEYTLVLEELLSVTKDDIKPIEEPIITIKGITYVMDKNLDKMSLGQFIDLDMIMKQGDVWDNAHKLCASFIRRGKISNSTILKKKLTRKPITCLDYEIEKYDYDKLVVDSEIFLEEMPMTFIYTCVTFFFTFRENLRKNYEGLFPTSRKGEIINEDDERPTKTLEEEYARKWNWYSIVRSLANGDITRIEEITEMNLIQVMNDLAFQKETEHLKKYINKED